MFRFLKKLLGAEEMPDPAPAPEPEPREPEPPVSTARLGEAEMMLDCTGVDWRPEQQVDFVRNVLPKHTENALTPLFLDPDFQGNPSFSFADAAILHAIVSEYQPTRVMEIGCGLRTKCLRHALKLHNLPAELIAVDPDPPFDPTEWVDAYLDTPVQELPLSDFEIMQSGEMVLFHTSHVVSRGSDSEHVLQEILPKLPDGLLVCFTDISLPRQYAADQLRAGFNEQDALLEYLRQSPRARVIAAGAWLHEHHPEDLRAGLPEKARGTLARSLWLRLEP